MTTATTADTDIGVVRAGFDAFATRDLAAFSAMFQDDATWNHRNDDRFGGVHHGRDMAARLDGMEVRAGASPHVIVGCRAGAGPGW